MTSATSSWSLTSFDIRIMNGSSSIWKTLKPVTLEPSSCLGRPSLDLPFVIAVEDSTYACKAYRSSWSFIAGVLLVIDNEHYDL